MNWTETDLDRLRDLPEDTEAGVTDFTAFRNICKNAAAQIESLQTQVEQLKKEKSDLAMNKLVEVTESYGGYDHQQTYYRTIDELVEENNKFRGRFTELQDAADALLELYQKVELPEQELPGPWVKPFINMSCLIARVHQKIHDLACSK